ncbi:ThiF family adenylyltransferase [Alkalinema pantanalense CENA528]|uniref:ThiF family adenylyltransferase n=1 Tax=Alkalinema pantanalense TaxID=1620705 RepID=UPI003D6FEF69
MSQTPIPESLLAARRNLDAISSVSILADWVWKEEYGVWVLHAQIKIESASKTIVPKTTEWYILASPHYPAGEIDFYPSKKNGLTKTFQHQSFNGIGKASCPWREGKLCLSTPLKVLGWHSHDVEPHDFHWRLHWHFNRAIEWLKAASEGTLAPPGDPFELPDFPLRASTRVVFTEGEESFAQWQQIPVMAGVVDLTPLEHDRNTFAVTSFKSIRYQELLRPRWGKTISDKASDDINGIWIRLNRIPVLEPWQVPSTWNELRDVCQGQQIELDKHLMEIFHSIRDGKRHLLLLGFSIPSEIGGSVSQMYWQPIELPILSHGQKTAKGFRTNEQGYWRRDRIELLDGPVPLMWAATENWHSDQISTRGRFAKTLTNQSFLVIGGGAVGSIVSELLIRGGVQKIALLDSDRLEIGNLSRHTLEMDSLGKGKAGEIAKHLNQTSPHAKVESINCAFPLVSEEQNRFLQQFEVILDCTGSDSVLTHLEQFAWESKKVFVSISLGMAAKRLFCFVAQGKHFPSLAFGEKIEPWLEKERQEHQDVKLPWAGVGCWHPVFPARADDVYLLASVGVKHLDSIFDADSIHDSLVVFEQIYRDNKFCRVQQVDLYEAQS